jgi:hypothetical protein
MALSGSDRGSEKVSRPTDLTLPIMQLLIYDHGLKKSNRNAHFLYHFHRKTITIQYCSRSLPGQACLGISDEQSCNTTHHGHVCGGKSSVKTVTQTFILFDLYIKSKNIIHQHVSEAFKWFHPVWVLFPPRIFHSTAPGVRPSQGEFPFTQNKYDDMRNWLRNQPFWVPQYYGITSLATPPPGTTV